jgi:transcriptional regulator with XRE-family HTH domain
MTRQKLPETEAQERIRIGATLRQLREARHVSLDELARAIDKSRPYLSRIESGDKPLTAELLGRIAHVLDVRPISIVRPDYFPANLPEAAAR